MTDGRFIPAAVIAVVISGILAVPTMTNDSPRDRGRHHPKPIVAISGRKARFGTQIF